MTRNHFKICITALLITIFTLMVFSMEVRAEQMQTMPGNKYMLPSGKVIKHHKVNHANYNRQTILNAPQKLYNSKEHYLYRHRIIDENVALSK